MIDEGILWDSDVLPFYKNDALGYHNKNEVCASFVALW